MRRTQLRSTFLITHVHLPQWLQDKHQEHIQKILENARTLRKIGFDRTRQNWSDRYPVTGIRLDYDIRLKLTELEPNNLRMPDIQY